jgi:serine phosphatase RsbU (regulator of sigma subunit)
MDIVICTLDADRKTLQYSGANNPLYLVRDHELMVYKADKQPVGRFVTQHKPFHKNTIETEPGDMIYLFTDGYQDQFGGEFGKKFMVGHFKKLLHEVHELPMPEQKEVLNATMQDWMMDTQQLDDILVIGLRV